MIVLKRTGYLKLSSVANSSWTFFSGASPGRIPSSKWVTWFWLVMKATWYVTLLPTARLYLIVQLLYLVSAINEFIHSKFPFCTFKCEFSLNISPSKYAW